MTWFVCMRGSLESQEPQWGRTSLHHSICLKRKRCISLFVYIIPYSAVPLHIHTVYVFHLGHSQIILVLFSAFCPATCLIISSCLCIMKWNTSRNLGLNALVIKLISWGRLNLTSVYETQETKSVKCIDRIPYMDWQDFIIRPYN